MKFNYQLLSNQGFPSFIVQTEAWKGTFAKLQTGVGENYWGERKEMAVISIPAEPGANTHSSPLRTQRCRVFLIAQPVAEFPCAAQHHEFFCVFRDSVGLQAASASWQSKANRRIPTSPQTHTGYMCWAISGNGKRRRYRHEAPERM